MCSGFFSKDKQNIPTDYYLSLFMWSERGDFPLNRRDIPDLWKYGMKSERLPFPSEFLRSLEFIQYSRVLRGHGYDVSELIVCTLRLCVLCTSRKFANCSHDSSPLPFSCVHRSLLSRASLIVVWSHGKTFTKSRLRLLLPLKRLFISFSYMPSGWIAIKKRKSWQRKASLSAEDRHGKNLSNE